MANSSPIQSHDLYQPGAQDTLAMLKKELVAIQDSMRALDAQARSLKKTLSSGVTSPQKVVAAATEADRIASAKKVLRLRKKAQMQRIATQTAKQQAIAEQQVAAATSRANIVRQREIDLLNRQATATKKHSGSLTGMIGSIRNLAYAYFSLGAAAQVFQNILKQTKALDTLTVAFNTTLGSTQATAQAQEYLLDISERFGANLLGASQAYLKFSAASTQAGVSAQQTQDIFTSVTKASSILGLGAERTSYVFLALEQIMSKGRLSTEELRRQLGEHLPGAFGIAAEAMGVTTAKLTDMLKKGEIASTDFLPKFAKQLELAYGIDQVERIDNLAAAQERFNNQLTLLIKEFDLSDAFKDFFNSMTEAARFVKENLGVFMALGKAVLYVAAAWTAWKVTMGVTRALMKFVMADTIAEITLTNMLAAAQLRLAAAQGKLNKAMAANPYGAALVAIIALVGLFDLLNKRMNAAAEFQKALGDATAKASAEVEFQEFAMNRLIDQYAKNEAALLKLKEGTAEYNAISKEQQGILTELNNLGLVATDINGDHKISIDELTTAKTKYIEKLEEEIILEELNARLKEAISKRIDEQNKLANFKPQNLFLNPQSIFAAAGTTKELENVNILIDKIKAEILSRKKDFTIAPKVVGGNGGDDESGDGKGKKEKDPRIVAIERLIALNELEEDSLKQRLDTIRLANEKEKILHENDNEYLLALEQSFQRELFDVQVRYLKEKQDKREEESAREKADFERATNDVKDYLEKRRQAIEAAENKRQSNVDALRDEFDARRKHEEDIFDLTKHSEEEIADFKLKLKIDELNDEIQLHRIFGKVLSDEELARAIELRDKMQAALDDPNTAGTEKGETDIFSLLNINFDSPEQKEALIDALDFAKQQLTDFLDFQKEIIDQEIENADRKVRAAEENLNRQIALQTANQANNVAGAQAELALAKKTQDEALKQRQKFQKTELALNTALEASNLAVAIAKTLAIFPGPVGIALAAAMIGAFAAAKIKAFQLANKKTFRKGGFEVIKGGSHESGNDTHVGGNNYAEREESVGIFTAKATRKYKPTLKALVNAANKGTLENILIQDRRAIQGINVVNKTDIDTSLMEKRLTRLVSLSEAKTFVDGKGRLVRIDRGRTTIINK